MCGESEMILLSYCYHYSDIILHLTLLFKLFSPSLGYTFLFLLLFNFDKRIKFELHLLLASLWCLSCLLQKCENL